MRRTEANVYGGKNLETIERMSDFYNVIYIYIACNVSKEH